MNKIWRVIIANLDNKICKTAVIYVIFISHHFSQGNVFYYIMDILYLNVHLKNYLPIKTSYKTRTLEVTHYLQFALL